MNRREFLRLSSYGILTAMLGGFTMSANAENFSTRKIDFHAHAILPSYVDAFQKSSDS